MKRPMILLIVACQAAAWTVQAQMLKPTTTAWEMSKVLRQREIWGNPWRHDELVNDPRPWNEVWIDLMGRGYSDYAHSSAMAGLSRRMIFNDDLKRALGDVTSDWIRDFKELGPQPTVHPYYVLWVERRGAIGEALEVIAATRSPTYTGLLLGSFPTGDTSLDQQIVMTLGKIGTPQDLEEIKAKAGGGEAALDPLIRQAIAHANARADVRESPVDEKEIEALIKALPPVSFYYFRPDEDFGLAVLDDSRDLSPALVRLLDPAFDVQVRVKAVYTLLARQRFDSSLRAPLEKAFSAWLEKINDPMEVPDSGPLSVYVAAGERGFTARMLQLMVVTGDDKTAELLMSKLPARNQDLTIRIIEAIGELATPDQAEKLSKIASLNDQAPLKQARDAAVLRIKERVAPALPQDR